MLKKFLILLFVFSFFYFGVFALTNDQKGSILNSFKERQFDLLFESTTGEITSEEKSLFNISKKINLYGNIEDNIYDARQSYENKLVENMEKISDLEEQIKSLEEDIENSTKRIGNINTKVIDVKKEINFSETTITLLKTKIDENKEILLKYLVYLYKKGNIVSGDFNDIDNLKSIILNSSNISDIINDLYFKGLIQITGKKLIDKHRDYISKLYINKIDLEKQENLLKNLRKNLILNRKIIDDKMEFKKEILVTSKGKQALYEKFIGDKLELEKNIKLKAFQEKIKFENIKDGLLEKYGCEFIDVGSNTVGLRTISDTCLTLNKMIYAESKLRGFDTDSNNIFSWPVNPIYGLSAYFHDNEYKELFGATHDAVDIIIEQGTSIQAPADGYVIFIELPKTPDYSYMALKHSDGFVTVFGHLSNILVEEYDYVTRGQIIAKTGGEYGTNGAGYITTGPHLHFEVYKDQEYVDPLNFLSLAELPYKYLDKKYERKYMFDFKEKKGYDFNHLDSNTRVFKLDGNSEIERQKSLIQKYAVGDFKNWQMWIDESLDGNIDPTFLMCIGLAETGLGRNMKTQYNVGNIGNTDSGATKQFYNARSGVYWMVKTLNNKYLGHYDAIKDLSRYGNSDGQIYASSPDHWHNNIIKCMTNIKGYYIPDNYNFRIMK